MEAPRGNPRPPEGINSPQTSGLGEFATLLAGIGLIVVAATAGLALAAGWLAPLVPYRWEEAVAGRFAPDARPAHPDAGRELQALAAALARAGELPRGMKIRAHLVEGGTPNAYATLGGHVFVTRALIDTISSENALAMVLAHEIAHVAHRDPIRALGRGAVIELVWAALVGGDGAAAASDVLGQAGLMTLLTFNRDMERRADRSALALVRRRYGHVRGAAEFFRKLLARRDEPAWTTLMRTHPRTRERLARIAAAAGADGDRPLAPLPPALRALHREARP